MQSAPQLLVAAVLLAVCSAHLCILNPVQRGGVSGVGKAGSPSCFNINPPCNKPKGQPSVSVARGTFLNVTIEKNLDHFNFQDAPGNFSINALDENDQPTMLLASVIDSGAPALTNYTFNLFVPKESTPGLYSIQAVYYTNNPSAPAGFYVCSDFSIV